MLVLSFTMSWLLHGLHCNVSCSELLVANMMDGIPAPCHRNIPIRAQRSTTMGSPGSLIRNPDSGWMGGTSTCIGEGQYPYRRSPWSLVGQKGIFSMEPCRTKYVLFSFQSLLSEPSIGTEPHIRGLSLSQRPTHILFQTILTV